MTNNSSKNPVCKWLLEEHYYQVGCKGMEENADYFTLELIFMGAAKRFMYCSFCGKEIEWSGYAPQMPIHYFNRTKEELEERHAYRKRYGLKEEGQNDE